LKNVYVIDGDNIHDLESFLHEFAIAVKAPNGYFGKNLAQFDDCLFGGYGLVAPCVVIWKNSEISKQKLDSQMLLNYYQDEKKYAEEGLLIEIEEFKYAGCNPDNRNLLFRDVIYNCNLIIEKAITGELTLFEDIVNLIKTVTERARFNNPWVVELLLE